MIERSIILNTPSFFPDCATVAGGTGGFLSAGTQAMHNNTMQWLPFAPNGINWVAMQGCDVVSGHFSGCIMATYTEAGVRKVCHVSTGAEYGDCRAAWDAAKVNFTDVFEFRPSDFIGDTAHTSCYGVITNDLQTLTVLTHPKDARFNDIPVRTQANFIKMTKARLLRD